MAPPSPIPSRAALIALRGVLFTTSCSVILLAEERRQRLKIARTAYENAKKLHTARSNRNCIVTSKRLSRRENQPEEPGDFATPTSNEERRNGQPLRDPSSSEINESLPVGSSSSPDSDESGAPRKGWSDWDATRKELARLSNFSPFAHNELFNRISKDNEPIDPKPIQRATPIRDIVPEMEPSSSTTPHSEISDVTVSNMATTEVPPDSSNSDQSVHTGPSPETIANQKAHTTAQSSSKEPETATPVITPAEDSIEEEITGSPEEWLIALDQILADLAISETNEALTAERHDSAIRLLKHLISSNVLESNLCLARGLRILESIVRLQAHSKMPAVLDILFPVCDDVCLLAVPAMDSLYELRDTKGTRQLIHHLIHSQTWKTQETPFNQRNPWINQMLVHYWRKTHKFDEIRAIYGFLQDAGLYDKGLLSITTQYAIRRRIALIALDACDDALAKLEMGQLRLLRPKAVEGDIKLRGRFAIRNASLGLWDAVWPELDALKAKGKGRGKTADYYQDICSWLTMIYCKEHTPVEIDAFVHDMISVYEMTLNSALAFLVLDRHGRNRDIQSSVNWLQFCHNNGLEMNQIFLNEVAVRCCRYWDFGRVDVVKILEGVKAFKPDIHDPHVTTYSVYGGMYELHKPLPTEDRPRWDSFHYATQLPENAGDSAALFERAAFRCMNLLAQNKDWEQVYDSFNVAQKRGMAFSSRCLRLAVVANLRMEGPHSHTAMELIGKAHANNHDVSEVLVPLQVARLEAGDNVGGVLQAALAHGSRIHDSVYNKAVRILIQKGLRDGAIRVCEVAAQQNGNGELAYNEHNFSNLVYAYTGQKRYSELEILLKSFIGKIQWWQGSKACKESLKRAMRTLAQRVNLSSPTEVEMHVSVLDSLNAAFEHVKKLRATAREDRETLCKEIIGAFKKEDAVQDEDPVQDDLELDSSEEADVVGGRMRDLRKAEENSTSDSWS